jgi:hypothetical protein
MLKLAILFRAMQLFAHSAHNLCHGSTFHEDHAFFGDAYGKFEGYYDSIIERLIGFGYESHLDLSQIIKEVSSKYSNTLFIVCCGPLSAVLIKLMFENNENNTYIDFGSSMDEFIHGKKTRPYMFENTQYSKMISSFSSLPK